MPFRFVSFHFVSLGFVSLGFVSFPFVSFPFVSLGFVSFLFVSFPFVSLGFRSVGRAFFSGFEVCRTAAFFFGLRGLSGFFFGLFFFGAFVLFFYSLFWGLFGGFFQFFLGQLSDPPPSLVIIKIHSRLPREGSIYPHFVHSITAFCPHLFCHIDPPNVPNMDQKHTPNVP